MKKRFSRATFHILVFVLLFGSTTLTVCSQEGTAPFSINESPLPAPTSPVTDNVGALDAATKQALEQKIIAFRDSTNPKVELAVAIVATTGDRPIFDYSLAVSRGWKIGSKEQDNPSALLFIAIDDRKYYTQVSKDLEDELPDGVVGQLQRRYLVPAFKQANYGKGISDTIDAYINQIRNKGNAETLPPATGTTKKQPTQKKGSISICGIAVCLIVLFVVVLPILSRFGSSKRRGRGDDDDWRGGGFGGGASSALPWVIGSILASGGGSSSSGSSDSGGGDSWGGFGGGGDFGGGGAGGDW